MRNITARLRTDRPWPDVGTRTGAHVEGKYDSQGMTGTMTISPNGS